LGRTNRSNGGNTSWQPRRKPPRKRNTKRTDARSEVPQSLSGEAPLERLFHRAICTFGGCRGARLVLETRIQQYGNGLHEQPPQESTEESSPQRRGHHPRQALFPHRRSCQPVPIARLRPSVLGNRISAAQAGKKQHWAAHVSQTRCGVGSAHQETAL